MAFKNPVVSPLTQSQEKLLGQLGSLKNILTLPVKKNLSIPEDKQISTFDYLLRVAQPTIGAAFIDIILKKFLDEVFNTQSDKLEKMILKGISKSLDAQNKHISSNPNETNEQWLNTNAAGPLHVAFQIVKALIVKQIIAMIFGPKDKMKHDTLGYQIPIDPNAPDSDTILDDVLASNSMFSLSNADNNQFGDQEYNLVQLKERLKKGEMIFTISCQDVKIKLPNDFDSQVDSIISNVISSIGTSIGPGSGQVPNPSAAFDYINNHVGMETQRINTPENSNAVRKSFLQILVEQILNTIIIAISPYLVSLINQINTTNPALNLTIIGLLSSPHELKNLSQSNETQFNTKSIFAHTLINALYALLLSMILKALIKEIKKLIKNAIAKRAATRLQNKSKRLSAIKAAAQKGVEAADKAKRAAEALRQFDDIFNYSNIV
jgi:hypothetical protein